VESGLSGSGCSGARIFPPTADGEWRAITLLNWLIFLMGYGAWRYLIRKAIQFYKPSLSGLTDHPVVIWTGCCAYLSCALCLDKVSDVCPDLLVTALFILALAEVLSLLDRPSLLHAAVLGAVLGAGYWVKGVFLSFDGIFILVLLLGCYIKKLPWRTVGISFLVFLAIFTPYVTAISWSYGQLTLGASGALNYAFHVNHIPHWTNWHGSPAASGALLYPTRKLVSDLPVFEFSEPFQTTYPPYNNMAYWYQGSGNFFSLRLQVIAVARTLYFLIVILKWNPFLWALTSTFLAVMLKREWRNSFLATAGFFWPLFLPTILGLAIYMAVHVEDRYISPFCLIFSLLPLLPLLDPAVKSRGFLVGLLLVFYTLGAAAQLNSTDRPALKAAIRQDDFHRSPQWRLAAALPMYGLRSGDPVALINDRSPGYRCHWAYVSHLRIVAEFGSLPWTIEPWDRTRFDPVVADPADEDYGRLFWNELTPERRAQVIDAFRDTGARAVLALSGPDTIREPGWQKVAGTNAWIYRF
ncbi:MAG: hypothetical protein ACRD9L_09515, partial [Bryobacteraceae bacterium]